MCFMTLLALSMAGTIKLVKEDEFIPILKQSEEKNTDGSFTYNYETANGSKRQEVGIVKNPGTDHESLVVKGSFSYIDVNGAEVIVQYIADENGYQPQGTIIPQEISQAAHNAAVYAATEKTLKTSS